MLPDKFNACDSIKLLLVMALRTGNVAETSIDDLLETTRKRKNRTVVWRDGTLPVLKAASNSHLLDLNAPAPEKQTCRILQQSSSLVGLLKTPGTHDIRRGVAFETSLLPSTNSVDGVDRAAQILGHTNKAKAGGLTAQYIGGAVESRLVDRLEVDFSSVVVKAPEQVRASYVSPTFSKAEVSAYMLSKGMSEQDKNERRKARRHMATAHKKEWVKANDQSQIEDLPLDESVVSIGKRKRAPELSQPADDPPVDPRLQEFTARLESGLSVQDLEDFDDLFDVEAASHPDSLMVPSYPGSEDELQPHLDHESQLEEGTESSTSLLRPFDPLMLPYVDFIDYFSRINLQTNKTMPANGGSKDKSTKFLYHCVAGCGRTDVDKARLDRHGASCDGTPVTAKPQIPCPRAGCNKTFGSESGLDNHIRDTHDWVPKACPRKECPQDVLYPDSNSRKKHMSEFHRFQPRTCPNCVGKAGEKKWKTLENFRVHHYGVHRMDNAQFNAMMKAEGNAGVEEDE
jgi:hypothetical protein